MPASPRHGPADYSSYAKIADVAPSDLRLFGPLIESFRGTVSKQWKSCSTTCLGVSIWCQERLLYYRLQL